MYDYSYSAGIGRTGTFIALDALYNEGERTGKVNVPQYVEKMRNDRMNMIQGEVSDQKSLDKSKNSLSSISIIANVGILIRLKVTNIPF